jgi:ABC-type cobalamin/Fe3+-siderophores transport system ATPase subunit
MGKLTIENFGPIDGLFEMDLDKKLTILIGEQATGKSTIARIVYYCLISILDEIWKRDGYIGEPLEDHKDAVLQYLRRNFCFGKVSFVNNDIILSFQADNSFSLYIPQNINSSNGPEALYIPAGRSTIPLLFESYTAVKNISVDPFFDGFLLYLDSLRKDYRMSMRDLLKETLENTKSTVVKEHAETAIGIIERILKGTYRYEKGNERIYYGDNASVPITAASSGQQEILYILMTLFDTLRYNHSRTIIIEEPEAHIFPETQKLIIELITLVINTTGSHIIITTHSPYILTSANLLIHSAKVENIIDNENPVVQPMARLKPSDVSAFMLERNGEFSYRSIVDEETGLINAEEIDNVSDLIDQGMSDLLNLEVKHGL